MSADFCRILFTPISGLLFNIEGMNRIYRIITNLF
jgi:hypothetical protein